MAKQSETRQAVERGARLLTLHYGNDQWLDKIIEEDLDLGNPRMCVLGQVTGGYSTGRKELGAGVQSYPSLFGFERIEGKNSYSLLTRVWLNFIRRAKAAR